MLNESFMRAVVAEKSRRRDELIAVRRLRAAGRDGGRSRVLTSVRSWWRRAGRRATPPVPESRPRLRVLGDDAFAP